MRSEGNSELSQQTVGQRLKQARTEQGLSLEDVEQAIKIHARHLEALERQDPQALPNPAWAHGFSVMYARYLKLDEAAIGLGDDGVNGGKDPGPRKRSGPRWRQTIRRRWPLMAAAFGGVAVTMAVILVTLFAPYNGLTKAVTDFSAGVAPELFLGSGPQRLVVLGSLDGSDNNGADSVMVAKVAEDGIGVLSIPQNTLTDIPEGYGTGKIGKTVALGGPDLTRRTVSRLTGTEVSHHIAIGTEGLGEIVDEMGGVQVAVPRGGISGRAPATGAEITLRQGSQTLNSAQASVYLRGDDLPGVEERAERRQDFLYSMLNQALGTSNLISNPTILNTVFENTETDMSRTQILQLAVRAGTLKNSGVDVKTAVVPGQEETIYLQQDTSADYWVPNAEELPSALEKTLR